MFKACFLSLGRCGRRIQAPAFRHPHYKPGSKLRAISGNERCADEKRPHFDVSAVAEVIEYSARLCQDQLKLTTHFAQIGDIVREAAFRGRRAGHSRVPGADVRRAVEERVYRSSPFRERVRAMIDDGTIMVDTGGTVVGQVNGVAVRYIVLSRSYWMLLD